MKLGDQSLSFLEKERYVLDNIETILNELRNGDLSKEDKLVLCDVAEKNNEPSILEELALFKGVSRVFADELMKNDKHGITHRIINDIKGSEIQCEADKRDLINKILETPNLLHLLIKALFSFVFVESIAKAFYDGEKAIRQKAIEIIGKVKSDRAMAILLKAIDDPADSVRTVALDILVEKYDESDYLCYIIEKEKKAIELKKIAEDGLETLKKFADNIPFVNTLITFFDSSLLKFKDSLNVISGSIGGKVDSILKKKSDSELDGAIEKEM